MKNFMLMIATAAIALTAAPALADNATIVGGFVAAQSTAAQSGQQSSTSWNASGNGNSNSQSASGFNATLNAQGTGSVAAFHSDGVAFSANGASTTDTFSVSGHTGGSVAFTRGNANVGSTSQTFGQGTANSNFSVSAQGQSSQFSAEQSASFAAIAVAGFGHFHF